MKDIDEPQLTVNGWTYFGWDAIKEQVDKRFAPNIQFVHPASKINEEDFNRMINSIEKED